MHGLIEQLKTDISELFATDETYSSMIVKEKYEVYPNITYPMTTIEEIENEDNQRYFDETERITNLGYQFAIYSEQSLDKTAIQNVRTIMEKLDKYLKGETYRCLRRIGTPVIVPLPSDENVMVGYLRYDCCLEQDTHTIYRRY
nr:MAG TPA: hypothetical protein [Bacteriophage sp.]